jgi:hypothetical protein
MVYGVRLAGSGRGIRVKRERLPDPIVDNLLLRPRNYKRVKSEGADCALLTDSAAVSREPNTGELPARRAGRDPVVAHPDALLAQENFLTMCLVAITGH